MNRLSTELLDNGDIDIRNVTDAMVVFYRTSGRRLAWREDRTPFKIYLSEILLQRTKAEQAEPVFRELVKRYPDVPSLVTHFDVAAEIMKPLGRYCRLEVFRKGLEYLKDRFNGQIPRESADLRLTPSIGPYIAAAIRVFGYGVPDVIIDANVVRVLGRIYGLAVTPETRRKKAFRELAGQHVPEDAPVDYSYGILDFASMVCRPLSPGCGHCGLNKICKYVRSLDGFARARAVAG